MILYETLHNQTGLDIQNQYRNYKIYENANSTENKTKTNSDLKKSKIK